MDVKQLIVQAFVKIGNNDGFDNITIKKIIGECNISRTTFYYYFNDLPDIIDFYLGEKIFAVSKVCVGLGNMKKGVTYCAENLIYNFPECRELLKSKWSVNTQDYLHKHWRKHAIKMISSNRKGIPIKEEERKFLSEFITGGILDFMMYGDHQEINIETFAEQFCLLLNARYAIMK